MTIFNKVISISALIELVAIFILTIILIISVNHNNFLKSKIDLNNQTIKQLELEVQAQKTITDHKEKQLNQLKTCKTINDYLKVWELINEENKRF